MAGWRCEGTDLREVLRRLHLGEPDRRIARELSLSRNAVASYRRWAERHELLRSPLPDAATLAALLRPPERERPSVPTLSGRSLPIQFDAWPPLITVGMVVARPLFGAVRHGRPPTHAA